MREACIQSVVTMARIRHVYASFLSVTWAFVGISAADESSALTSTFMSDSPEVLETSCLSQGSEPNGYDGLAAVLSVDADIYYPNSTGFSNATTRWSVGYNPKPNVVVVPATADDVAATVCQTWRPESRMCVKVMCSNFFNALVTRLNTQARTTHHFSPSTAATAPPRP